MKTKVLLFAVLILAVVKNNYAQAPVWQWAKGAGGTVNDYAYATATDASGNVYMAGSFASTSITFGSYTFTGNGFGTNLYLVKYNSSGTVIWGISAGVPNYNDDAKSVAVDASGNVYITGSFTGTSIVFGSDTLLNAGAVGSADVFLVKYNSSGTLLWAKRAGGTAADVANGVTADAFGNVYIAGGFNSSPMSFDTITLSNAGNADVFLAKYDSSGNVIWAKGAGGSANDAASSVASDAFGNVYIAGSFSSTSITFDSATLMNANATSAALFLARYDSSGKVIWAKSAGGTDNVFANSVVADAKGHVYIAGNFLCNTITFADSTLTNAYATVSDIFLAQYDSTGNALWAIGAGGDYQDVANCVATDATGNVYMTGYFYSSPISFGTITLTNTSFNNADVFVAKFNSSGVTQWALSTGGIYGDFGQSVVVDASGNVYVAGYYNSSTLSFGSTTLTNASNLNTDIFLAKLSTITGVENSTVQGEMSIYPNPSREKLNISLPESEKISEIEIYNVLGEKVSNLSEINLAVAGTKSEINISGLRTGVYFVRVTGEKKDWVEKLIIE